MRAPFLPLSAWIERKHPLPERFYHSSYADVPSKEWNVWVGLEEENALHDAAILQWQGLEASIAKTQSYLHDAGKIISGLSGGWLDSEEREMILSEIGTPPAPCLPIYIITTRKDEHEEVQYIGKTANEKRFKGGHSIALKLLDPKYNQFEKRIYRCSVWFHFNEEYIALEWIKPESLALKLLDDIETNLISYLKPPLNSHKKKGLRGAMGFDIHIQNFCSSIVLNDSFIWNTD